MFSSIAKEQSINHIIHTEKRIDILIDIDILFSTLKQYYKIPDFQRILNKEKVEEIIRIQEEHIRKDGIIKMYQNIMFIEVVKTDDKNSIAYLIDGQHRFKAIEYMYYNNCLNQIIPITIIKCNSYEEMKKIFLEINKNTEMPEYILNDFQEKNSVNQVFKHFYNKYPKIWKCSKNPRRPFLKDTFFQDGLAYLIEKLEEHNIKEANLIDSIEKEHSIIKKKDLETIIDTKNPYKTIEKCKISNCYLGLFPLSSSRFKYYFFQNCFERLTGIHDESISNKVKNKTKKTIPYSLKSIIWNKYIGKDIGVSYCWCCSEISIDKRVFHAGHIIPESKGGKINVDNLRPICASCNTSMRDQNMFEFIKTYFPRRYDEILLNEYSQYDELNYNINHIVNQKDVDTYVDTDVETVFL